ncbi:uncharacterized protein LOC134460560 [Engraulis encrasicolus]|uniref:uncharacterized protein LOC134460560 n=1 Tax=Engraulis encrasicolus TaxID=184585 RepID=UPI002FD67A97
MNSVKGLLRNTMEDLCEKDLKKMKHLLRDDGKIMWSKLEHADGDDIVDLIVEVYTEEKSVETVINKLKHMNLNQKVEDLQKHLADVKAESPASQSVDSTVPTTERGFLVGDRVRVRASVVEPKHKWGNVTHSSVGVVKAFKPSGLMLVDFPGKPGWTAEPSEMELQGFVVGDRVRVKTTVKEPKHKWGSVTHSSVGVVKDFIPNGQMLVDFPGHSAWRADPSEMEYQGFMVGDRVRVKASVEEPKYKWGAVTHSSVGVFKAFTQNGLMLVDFPGVTGWTADPADMELLGRSSVPNHYRIIDYY